MIIIIFIQSHFWQNVPYILTQRVFCSSNMLYTHSHTLRGHMCWEWPSLHSLAAAWNMVAALGHVVHACQRSNVTYRSEEERRGRDTEFLNVTEGGGRRCCAGAAADGWRTGGKYVYFMGLVEIKSVYLKPHCVSLFIEMTLKRLKQCVGCHSLPVTVKNTFIFG